MTLKHLATLCANTLLAVGVCLMLTFCGADTAVPPTARQAATRTPKPAKPTAGPTVFTLSSAATLGVVVNGDMQIVQVVPGSAADKGGVKSGDFIRSVNDQPVDTPLDARRAFFSKPLSQKTHLVIVRGGKVRTFDIKPVVLSGSAGDNTPTPVPADASYF